MQESAVSMNHWNHKVMIGAAESRVFASVYRAFWRFCKFSLVGACATAIHYILLMAVVELAHLRVVFASTIGFVVAATVSYALNRRFTFESNAKHAVALPKFLTVAILGAAMNAAVVGWFEAHTSIHYLLAQVCATLAVLLWNFTVNALWTFRREPGEASNDPVQ
jgi:putative flippase GtrA